MANRRVGCGERGAECPLEAHLPTAEQITPPVADFVGDTLPIEGERPILFC
jgi:hypothetical protein